MKRNYYKGFYTNGTVKNIGKITNGKVYFSENNGKINKKCDELLKELNYCYCKRELNNKIKFKSIEKRKPMCNICNKKCYSPVVYDYYNYKLKSKKKSKGLNKRKRFFLEINLF